MFLADFFALIRVNLEENLGLLGVGVDGERLLLWYFELSKRIGKADG